MRVPRFVGLMAVDARETAEAHGVLLAAPDRPDFGLTVVDYVVRQYPPPGSEVPRGTVVTVWFDFGEGEGGGGAGVREPRLPPPPSGGLRCTLAPPSDTLSASPPDPQPGPASAAPGESPDRP